MAPVGPLGCLPVGAGPAQAARELAAAFTMKRVHAVAVRIASKLKEDAAGGEQSK
jgi:hypothetical protein